MWLLPSPFAPADTDVLKVSVGLAGSPPGCTLRDYLVPVSGQTAAPHLLLGQGNMDCILGAADKLISYSFWPSYSLGHQSRLKRGLKNDFMFL